MKIFLIGFVVGWFFGASALWFYFLRAGLIRSRDEYYAARQKEPNE